MNTDGGTSALGGDFQAVAQKSFALDYKGSAFNALLAGVQLYYAFVDISVILEAGTPNPEVANTR